MSETLNEKSIREDSGQISPTKAEVEQARQDASGLRPWTTRPIPLLLGILLVWIGVGAYLTYLYCCLPQSRAAQAAVWSVADDDQTIANGDENITFAYATETPIIADETATEYGKIATYMKENDDKVLRVNTTYSEHEANPTDYENLGQARAALLQEKLVALGIPSERIVTTVNKEDNPIHWQNTVYGAANLEVETLEGRYLSLYEAGGLNTDANDNLKFEKNSPTFDKPVTTSIRAALGSLADYLKNNADKNLQLTGWFDKSEKKPDGIDNLGKSRAENIKNFLVSLGAPANQIKLNAKERDDLVFINNKLYGGAAYEFLDKDGKVIAAETDKETDKDTDNLADATNANASDIEQEDEQTQEEQDDEEVTARDAKPIDKKDSNKATTKKGKAPAKAFIYFATSQASSTINATTKTSLDKVLQYAKNNSNTIVLVDGYTDSTGSIPYNSELSKRRATFAKDYLVNKGLTANRVKLRFLGSENAIGDNNSEEGRAKNRRVEIYMEK